jgi:nicotinamidase-related amidase
METEVTTQQNGISATPAQPLAHSRSRHLLSRDQSRLLVIDVQEKFVPHLTDGPRLVANCRLLVEGARLLGVPVSVSEQNPTKLGATVTALSELLPPAKLKMRFSSAECLLEELTASGPPRHQIVICGIETHVCVQQTALDLLAWGWDVYVVADAVQSRFETDRTIALQRMSAAGVTLVSAESVLFEWCETAEAAEFRDVSRLVKSHMKSTAG